MTPTQKKVVEVPILLVILWIVQALQVSLLQLPFGYGSIDFIGVLLSYFALTRGWGRLAILSFIFSYLGSFTVGYSTTVYVAVSLWTALIAKIFVSEFTMEGRRLFVVLAAGTQIFARMLSWAVLKSLGHALPVGHFLASLPLAVAAAAALAWLIFPGLVGWDEYFQHPIDEARDLNPDILR